MSDNAPQALNIVDPANNYAFELHQYLYFTIITRFLFYYKRYLDSDSSGTSGTCVSATIGSER